MTNNKRHKGVIEVGLRDIANAAIDAEEAQKKADAKRWQNENARAGERIVKDLLGITGKAVRAFTGDRSEATGPQWGNGTVVELEDDVCVIVTHWVSNKTDRYGYVTGTETRADLKLCNREGDNLLDADGQPFYSPSFSTLPELGRALAALDEAPAKRREEAERIAAARERDAARREEQARAKARAGK